MQAEQKERNCLVNAHQSEVQDIQRRLNDKNSELEDSAACFKKRIVQLTNDILGIAKDEFTQQLKEVNTTLQAVGALKKGGETNEK